MQEHKIKPHYAQLRQNHYSSQERGEIYFLLLVLVAAPFGVAIASCAPKLETFGAPRPEVLRDMESYAIASCLTIQTHPYLKDQGDAWALVIAQRMQGDLDVLANIAEQVKHESAKGEMAVVRDETGTGKDKPLPVLYCNEIIDKPSVCAAIQRAVAMLGPSYK